MSLSVGDEVVEAVKNVVAPGLVLVAVAAIGGCAAPQPGDPSCSDAVASDLRVTGEAAPEWSDEWLSQAGGALGGGWVDPEGDVFARVYSCVGLDTIAFREITGTGKKAEQRDVRVGVADYLYRAGDVSTPDGRYSVDIAVSRSEPGPVRFGVAFSPLQTERTYIDVYSGAFVVQQMRESGIL
ncbi:hypothetical protein CH263_10555 [Rhodococcus sp. 06-1059B-a]|nr:hypothetical protein CH263_10555 [Rhodococcus sp. 06-1059B-a]OZF06797.1 hypothetical protein CH300_08360 [Rhodococcus sp. 15-1154-1]